MTTRSSASNSTRTLLARLLLLVPLAAPVWAPVAARAEGQLDQKEFHAVTYYKTAIDHPQVQKLKSEKARVAAIAKDIKMSPKDLEKALEKAASLGGEPSQLAGQAIRGALDGLRVKGRVLDVSFNVDEPKHVVAYVRWTGSKAADVLKEASEIAYTVKAEAPFVSTLSLAAMPPSGGDQAVWSAKIGAEPMSKIQLKRIEDYAERLYVRLFEVVDNKPF
jgi:hypothetical protein